MKKQIALLVLILFTVSAVFAQDEDFDGAPLNVEKAFKKKFSKAQSTAWEMDEDGNWEAEFKMDAKSYSSTYSEDGMWLSTESTIKQSEIPQAVIASLNKRYQKYKITEAELVESKAGKFYEIELERGTNVYEVLVDSKGNIIEQEEEDEEVDYEVEEDEDEEMD